MDDEGWKIVGEGVTPEAAVEFWKQRAKLTDAQAKALAEGARQRAFYVTGLARHDLVTLVSDGIQHALEHGDTLATFKERIAAAITAQGWHDRRVENIFRTNMQHAYMAGRYKKMQAVKASRPYWQYLAVMDKRVRPNHAILHEKVYPADHEFWDANYPPNGFRCRCTVATLSERQVRAQGLTVETEMPKPGVWTDPKTGMEYHVNLPGADKGFNQNPGKDWLGGLNLNKYPDVNKASYTEQRVRPAPVKTYAELCEGIRQRCAQFATNNGIASVEVVQRRAYFMGTDCNGGITLNAKTFRTLNGFNPAKDLKTAWNKLAKGKELAWNEEYAMESLWHELTHNRQKHGHLGKKDEHKRLVMELFTQWTARRTYPQFLEALGGKAVHQASIKAKGLGYNVTVPNFDTLLRALKIKEEDVLPLMLKTMDTTATPDYGAELLAMLARLSGRDVKTLEKAVKNLGSDKYEEGLKTLKLV